MGTATSMSLATKPPSTPAPPSSWDPTPLFKPLLDGVTVEQDCSNLDSLPDITFTFDSQDYVLTPADYVLKETVLKNTQCIMGIMGADLPEDFKYVIVGDVFMRKFPT